MSNCLHVMFIFLVVLVCPLGDANPILFISFSGRLVSRYN
ncbi:hypothetical protein GLYMA_11G103250v4 [Glycine max]|nr:hypothetical protein GLYMA_11G103250v4 [Glycine max]KAH1158494.1 hypothetical protein GYH30_030624 [Glycine max]